MFLKNNNQPFEIQKKELSMDKLLYFNTPWYIAAGYAGPWAKILACKPF